MQSFAIWQKLRSWCCSAINCFKKENYCFAVRCMKLAIIILTVGCLHVHAKGYSQKITLSLKDASITEVFTVITNQTGYQFLFNEEQLNTASFVTIKVKDASIQDVLDACLKYQPFNYSIRYKVIIIKPIRVAANIQEDKLQSDLIDIKGKVINENGEPMEGVSVRVKGKNIGASTDSHGQFFLKAVPANGVLMLSAVNIQDVEWKVGGQSEMIVNVKTKVTQEQEVAVVVSTGYQDIPKERATGSFVQIGNELFNRRVGYPTLDRIADLVPGLITSKSIIGNTIDGITIRGVSTINANKQPLLVLDNFIYEGSIDAINPNDIESVTVLKDAAAASIWGVRAGNGVIVLTTKKGRFSQKPVLSLNSNITFGKKPDLFYIPSIPSKDVIALEKKRFTDHLYDVFDDAFPSFDYFPTLPTVPELLLAVRRGEITQEEADTQISKLENHDVRNDINKHLLQTSISQQYALNITGGVTNYRYYGSIGYDKVRMNEMNTTTDRFTLRFNNAWKVFKDFELKAELAWASTTDKNANSLGSYSTILTSPYTRLTDENGNAIAIPWIYRTGYADTINYPGLLDWHFKPLDEVGNGNFRNQQYNTRVNVGVSYLIISGLQADLNFQWQNGFTETRNIRNSSTFYTRDYINQYVNQASNGQPIYPIPLGDVLDHTNASNVSWNFRSQLSYSKGWKNYQINALVGIETRETQLESLTMPTQFGFNPQTYTFSTLKYGTWNLRPSLGGLTGELVPSSSSLSGFITRFGSYFTNAAFTISDKYVVSGSARIDQSNFFGVKANDRKVPLWSTGVLWHINKENFYNVTWMPTLRFRVTYGFNGNTTPGISPLATANYINPSAPLNTVYASLRTSPNPQLRWEKVENINIGLDFANKENRISGSIEFYRKKGMNLISAIDVDPTSGFTTYFGNNGSIKTQGIDISIITKNINSRVKWETNFLFAHNTDKVTSYKVKPPQDASGFVGGNPIVEGKPLSKIYSYAWAGLDPANGDARLYINKQIVGSKNYSQAMPEDVVYNGPTSPILFGSIRNTFEWQNISLSTCISYRIGYYFRRSSFTGSLTSVNTWQHADYLKTWKTKGDEVNIDVPGFLESYDDNRYLVYTLSEILIEKGDHLRLQDVRVGYTLKSESLKKNIFSNIQLYGYINNIGILWRANDMRIDPEAATFGSIPIPTTFTVGANISF